MTGPAGGARRPRRSLRIVCLSDTHNLAGDLKVPDGDILLHAGDLTQSGSEAEVAQARSWLASLPHPHKVVIAGNHDFLFESRPETARAIMSGLTYLQDSSAEIAGLSIWGSPWSPWFLDWAFNLERGPEIRGKWDLIPQGIDILLTHGPSAGHGDTNSRGEAVGCADLLEAVRRVRPKLHVFGHIHEGCGTTREGATVCVNASTCDRLYRPVHPPVVIDWPILQSRG